MTLALASSASPWPRHTGVPRSRSCARVHTSSFSMYRLDIGIENERSHTALRSVAPRGINPRPRFFSYIQIPTCVRKKTVHTNDQVYRGKMLTSFFFLSFSHSLFGIFFRRPWDWIRKRDSLFRFFFLFNPPSFSTQGQPRDERILICWKSGRVSRDNDDRSIYYR